MFIVRLKSGSFKGRDVFICHMSQFGGVTKREAWTRAVDCALLFPDATTAMNARDALADQEKFKAPEQNNNLQKRLEEATFEEVDASFVESLYKSALFESWMLE